MKLFPDSTPKYVTAAGSTQPVRGTDGGLFGGCGFLGLFPKAPQYVGAAQPVGCQDKSLFGLFDVAQPHCVTPPPDRPPVVAAARVLPSRTHRDDDDKAKK